MSIFRSNPQSADLSALLDNELPPRTAQIIEHALQDGRQDSQLFDRLRHVHALIDAYNPDAEQVENAEVRVRARLDRSIQAVHHRDQRSWWERSVTIPMPVAATAVVVAMMFALILAGRMATPGDTGGSQPTAETAQTAETAKTAESIAGRAGSLNVQVTVDGGQTEDLLRWLNDQQSVETVTIQLPDTAQFQLRGEPVFLRPELPGERASDVPAEKPFDITPLEESEE